MNTALEILEAMIEAEGPVRGWVLRDDEETWNECIITGVEMGEDPCMDVFFSYGIAHNRASLDNPNLSYKPLGPWVNDWAKYRAVDQDGMLYEYQNEPWIELTVWECSYHDVQIEKISEGHDPTNWKSSLEKRVAYKPLGPWKNDWATFRAVDRNGYLYEFEIKPSKLNTVWDGENRCDIISKGHDTTNWENSLEERPKDERDVCPNCGTTFDGRKAPKSMQNKTSYGCPSCQHPVPKTRPMTAREFARFVGENMGQYLYRSKSWREDVWCMDPNIDSGLKRVDYLYAHNTDGDLEWMELPQVEVE